MRIFRSFLRNRRIEKFRRCFPKTWRKWQTRSTSGRRNIDHRERACRISARNGRETRDRPGPVGKLISLNLVRIVSINSPVREIVQFVSIGCCCKLSQPYRRVDSPSVFRSREISTRCETLSKCCLTLPSAASGQYRRIN